MTWRNNVIGIVERSVHNFICRLDVSWNVDENGNIRNFCRNCFRCNYRSRGIKSKPLASIISGMEIVND